MCVIRIVFVSNYSSSLLSFIMIVVLFAFVVQCCNPSSLILCLLHCFHCVILPQKNILCYHV